MQDYNTTHYLCERQYQAAVTSNDLRTSILQIRIDSLEFLKKIQDDELARLRTADEERETSFASFRAALRNAHAQLTQLQADAIMRDTENATLKAKLQEREDLLTLAESQICGHEQKLKDADARVHAAEHKLERMNCKVRARELTLKAKEDGLRVRERRNRDKEDELSIRELLAQAKEDELQARERQAVETRKVLDIRELHARDNDARLDARQQQVKEKEDELCATRKDCQVRVSWSCLCFGVDQHGPTSRPPPVQEAKDNQVCHDTVPHHRNRSSSDWISRSGYRISSTTSKMLPNVRYA